MQDSRLMMGIVTALGGNPISMPTGDTYSALQTGVVDGAENNIPSYDSFGHYEVAHYYSYTEHSRVPELLMMSKAVMDKLPAEDQAIIKQAARDTQAYQIQKWAEREVTSLETVQKNPNVQLIKIAPEEWAKFSAAMEPLHAEFGKGYEDIIEQIKNTQ
jgi:TRAP-type C4-dicarboxylate transport system substrate-binding protein